MHEYYFEVRRKCIFWIILIIIKKAAVTQIFLYENFVLFDYQDAKCDKLFIKCHQICLFPFVNCYVMRFIHHFLFITIYNGIIYYYVFNNVLVLI